MEEKNKKTSVLDWIVLIVAYFVSDAIVGAAGISNKVIQFGLAIVLTMVLVVLFYVVKYLFRHTSDRS